MKPFLGACEYVRINKRNFSSAFNNEFLKEINATYKKYVTIIIKMITSNILSKLFDTYNFMLL